jgi:hypothetical protein
VNLFSEYLAYHIFFHPKPTIMQPSSKKTVTKMREAYERTIRKASTENLKRMFPDRPHIEEAASTWISRKDLDALLNANNADGLRIYYGCHHQSTHHDPKLDYNGLHNLIFVATKDSNDPQNPSPQTSIDQLSDTVGKSDTDGEEPADFEGSAAADGLLCPPFC